MSKYKPRSGLEAVIVNHFGEPSFEDGSGNPHWDCPYCHTDGGMYCMAPKLRTNGKPFAVKFRCPCCRHGDKVRFGDGADIIALHSPGKSYGYCKQAAIWEENYWLKEQRESGNLGNGSRRSLRRGSSPDAVARVVNPEAEQRPKRKRFKRTKQYLERCRR